jgi:hypothetical protein
MVWATATFCQRNYLQFDLKIFSEESFWAKIFRNPIRWCKLGLTCFHDARLEAVTAGFHRTTFYWANILRRCVSGSRHSEGPPFLDQSSGILLEFTDFSRWKRTVLRNEAKHKPKLTVSHSNGGLLHLELFSLSSCKALLYPVTPSLRVNIAKAWI